MKRNRLVVEPLGPVKPISKVGLVDEEERKFQDESNLSPERMTEGSSTTTVVLSQILAQREGFHQLRDWGINE